MSLTAHWRGLWASRLAFNKLHMPKMHLSKHFFEMLFWLRSHGLNAFTVRICCTSWTDVHTVTVTDQFLCWLCNCELCGLEGSLKGCWEKASRRWAWRPTTGFVAKVNYPWGTWHQQTDIHHSQALLTSSGVPHPQKITLFYNYYFQSSIPGRSIWDHNMFYCNVNQLLLRSRARLNSCLWQSKTLSANYMTDKYCRCTVKTKKNKKVFQNHI